MGRPAATRALGQLISGELPGAGGWGGDSRSGAGVLKTSVSPFRLLVQIGIRCSTRKTLCCLMKKSAWECQLDLVKCFGPAGSEHE